MQIFELVGVIVFFAAILLCAAFSSGGRTSGRVKVSRPDEKTVDGFGGTRGYDYSYSGQSSWGGDKPFPVGLRQEREKTDTHMAYKHDEDDN